MNNGTDDFEMPMRRAIFLAKRAWGNTHPNPLVGAVIVENGVIVAEGWHEKSGEPHAERMALKNLGRPPKPDSTLFVTLEPCSTHGRTGACTGAILEAKIRRVVIGAIDPNPAHAGRGIELLRANGIKVFSGILSGECADLNLIFNHWISQKTPLFALKTATTLDGKIATRGGDSRWLTGAIARADVHRWRRYFPAIATGSGTALADNPSLTSRIENADEFCPVRFVFDRRLRVAEHPELHVFTDSFSEKTIVVTANNADCERAEILKKRGVKIWFLRNENDTDFWREFKARCAAENIHGVWFEGGGAILGAALKNHVADYFFQYIAPKIFGDEFSKMALTGNVVEKLDNSFSLKELQRCNLGDDTLVRGAIIYPN